VGHVLRIVGKGMGIGVEGIDEGIGREGGNKRWIKKGGCCGGNIGERKRGRYGGDSKGGEDIGGNGEDGSYIEDSEYV